MKLIQIFVSLLLLTGCTQTWVTDKYCSVRIKNSSGVSATDISVTNVILKNSSTTLFPAMNVSEISSYKSVKCGEAHSSIAGGGYYGVESCIVNYNTDGAMSVKVASGSGAVDIGTVPGPLKMGKNYEIELTSAGAVLSEVN